MAAGRAITHTVGARTEFGAASPAEVSKIRPALRLTAVLQARKVNQWRGSRDTLNRYLLFEADYREAPWHSADAITPNERAKVARQAQLGVYCTSRP